MKEVKHTPRDNAESERDRLKEEVEHSNKLISSYQLEVSQRKEENERLKAENDGLSKGLDSMSEGGNHWRKEAEKLQSINRELVEALKPFEKLAHVVLDDNSFEGNRTLYAFDKAEITYDDLRNVLQALKNSTL